MHGLRTDLMIWFSLELQTKFGGLVLHCFAGNTGRFFWQTSFYLQTFSSGMISNFSKFLSTALQYLQTEGVKNKTPHSDFWLRWNSEDFKEKLQSSRPKILNKDLTLEELRLLYETQNCEELLATSESIGDLV